MGFRNYIKAVLLLLLVAFMGSALAEPANVKVESLDIKRERVKINFNTMIDSVGKESAGIAESMQVEDEEALEDSDSSDAEVAESDSKRVDEFLQVEMGMADSSPVAGNIASEPTTPITTREDIIFEETMEMHDSELEENHLRGPGSVAREGFRKSSKPRELAPN